MIGLNDRKYELAVVARTLNARVSDVSVELGRVNATEGKLAIRSVERGRRLEGYSDFVGINQPLSECVVGDGGDTRAGVRNQCSCVMRE